jgi:hypothetical protein
LKKLSLIAGGVAGLALATFLTTTSQAADHGDSTTLLANPLGDINDLYTWMTSDGAKLNLVLTVSPLDTPSRTFGPAVQYAFHIHSRPGTSGAAVVAQAAGTLYNVICTFASNTSAQCWVTDSTGMVKDYVTGDPSSAAGMTSASGKVKVHAGRHSDPFFFNLQGFRNAIATVQGAVGAGGVMFNAFGCPNNLPDTTIAALTTTLKTQQANGTNAVPPCSAMVIDCFAGFDVKAIVVQVDKTLVLNGTDTFLSVWASTHTTP